MSENQKTKILGQDIWGLKRTDPMSLGEWFSPKGNLQEQWWNCNLLCLLNTYHTDFGDSSRAGGKQIKHEGGRRIQVVIAMCSFQCSIQVIQGIPCFGQSNFLSWSNSNSSKPPEARTRTTPDQNQTGNQTLACS